MMLRGEVQAQPPVHPRWPHRHDREINMAKLVYVLGFLVVVLFLALRRWYLKRRRARKRAVARTTSSRRRRG